MEALQEPSAFVVSQPKLEPPLEAEMAVRADQIPMSTRVTQGPMLPGHPCSGGFPHRPRPGRTLMTIIMPSMPTVAPMSCPGCPSCASPAAWPPDFAKEKLDSPPMASVDEQHEWCPLS